MSNQNDVGVNTNNSYSIDLVVKLKEKLKSLDSKQKS